MSGTEQYQAQLMRQQATGDLGRIGLLMLGVGAGFRGLKGLMALGSRNMRRRTPPLRSQQPVKIPVRQPQDEEKRRKAAGWTENVADWTGSALGKVFSPFGKAMRGEGITSPTSWPPFIPLALLGGGAAAFGGYKLTDKLMDSRRKKEMDERLRQAKEEYEQTLAGRSKVSADLDRLYDGQKSSDWIDPDTAGKAMGTALTLGGLLGIGSGMLTYNLSKKKRPSEVLRIAKQRRARERMRRAPMPIYAQPSFGSAPDEDELAGEILDKESADTPNPPPPIPVKSVPATTPETPDVLSPGMSYNPLPIGSDSNHPGHPTTPPPLAA